MAKFLMRIKKTRKVKLWDKAAHIILQEYEKYLKKGVRQ